MPDFDEMLVFGKKTAADLMKEIHEKTNKKDKIIHETIDTLKDMIQNIGDAVQLGPMMAQYMEVWVKSDEHMIKLLAIVTRAAQKDDNGDEIGLSEEEKKMLIQLTKDIHNPQASA